MASEPAEPTTRQALVDKAAQAITRNAELIAVAVKACKCCASSGYSPGGGAPYPSECAWCDHEPDRHGEKELAKLRGPVSAALSGLLADPAQTTDSDDWVRLKQVLGIANSEPLPGNEDAIVATARMYIDRTRLSLLLRGMARKLVAYRKWTLGDDVPAVHRLRRELAEEKRASFALYVRVHQALGVSFTDSLSGLTAAAAEVRAERDERQARIDAVNDVCEAADVLIRMDMATSTLRWETAAAVLDDVRAALVGDQPPGPGLTHVLAWLNRKVEQIEAEGDIDNDPKTDGQHYAYVQAHAAVGLAITHPERWMNEVWPPLSGEALRAVEEAVDAAGDAP